MKAMAMALAAVTACSGAATPLAPTAAAHEGDVVERVLLTGALHPAEAAEIAVPQTDQNSLAIRWLVAPGTRVHAGDRVAELDNTGFLQPLADLRTSLAAAELKERADVHTDLATIAKQRDAVRGAEIDRDKAVLLAGVPADLVDAKTAHERAIALVHAQTALAMAREDLATTIEATAVNAKLRAFDLERTRRAIAATEQQVASLVRRAPRDGVAVIAKMPSSDRELRVGDAIGPNTPLVSLPDFDQAMQVAATLSDVDDGRVAVGVRGACTLDAYPDEPIGCAVTAIEPVARTAVGRVTLRRSFDVTLELAPSDVSRLRAGMSFEIEVRAAAVHGVVVPRGAVVRGQAGAWVVMAGGAVRDVALAACDAQQCAIASGLAAGETVQVGGKS